MKHMQTCPSRPCPALTGQFLCFPRLRTLPKEAGSWVHVHSGSELGGSCRSVYLSSAAILGRRESLSREFSVHAHVSTYIPLAGSGLVSYDW